MPEAFGVEHLSDGTPIIGGFYCPICRERECEFVRAPDELQNPWLRFLGYGECLMVGPCRRCQTGGRSG